MPRSNRTDRKTMTPIRRRFLTALVVATGAVAGIAPMAHATNLPGWADPITGVTIGGDQIGSAYCVGTNRPSFAGNNGSTSAQTCGALSSTGGPQTGQIATVSGTTTTASPGAQVT